MIPFVDLTAQYETIQSEIDLAMKSVITDTAFIGGKYASKFESEFAGYLGVKHCVACANGTDSLEILLRAMGVSDGDEVIVPAVSWISTSEAVSSVGGIPIFVDSDPDYFTIDISKIEDVITEKTKVIIPVHLYGQPVDMISIMKIAEKHGLKVLEDCAQAHGAMFNGQKIGTFGQCASYSFYPGKNLGAYGDAGCMVTNDDDLARTARMIANHGQEGKHNHIIEGRNSRMDGLHAAVLSVKLKYIDAWTDSRINHAKSYSEKLANGKSIIPQTISEGKHVFHLYVIRTEKRDELKTFLSENGVTAVIHYPKALPFLDCYSSRNFVKTDFPIAAQFQDQILSLPMFAELTDPQISEVVRLIQAFEV